MANTKLEEYQSFQQLYGTDFTSQVFGDLSGYTKLRKMHSFIDMAHEMSNLEEVEQ